MGPPQNELLALQQQQKEKYFDNLLRIRLLTHKATKTGKGPIEGATLETANSFI